MKASLALLLRVWFRDGILLWLNVTVFGALNWAYNSQKCTGAKARDRQRFPLLVKFEIDYHVIGID